MQHDRSVGCIVQTLMQNNIWQRSKLECGTYLFSAGSGLVYLNLSDRTVTKGISVGQDNTVILSIDGDLEKVNYLGADYHLHTLEVNYFCCWFHSLLLQIGMQHTAKCSQTVKLYKKQEELHRIHHRTNDLMQLHPWRQSQVLAAGDCLTIQSDNRLPLSNY